MSLTFKTLRFFVSALLIVWMTSNVGQAQELPFSSEFSPVDIMFKSNFFKNSIRRNPTIQEERLIVRAVKEGKDSGCTGFFVRNDQNKFYIGSARHCYGYQADEACKNNKIRILPSGSMKHKFIGTCNRIVAGTEKDDLFIMEMTLLNRHSEPASEDLMQEVRGFYIPLNLTSYAPPVFFPLKMLGYPGDEYRNSRPTVSENCYVQPDSTAAAIDAIPENLRDPRYAEWLSQKKAENPLTAKLGFRIRKMNCSVYGGNSGGPIIIENSLDLLGLPLSYYPGLYNKIPENYATKFEEVKNFVERNLNELQANGIFISDQPRFMGANLDYLKRFNTAGRYESPDQSCAIRLRVDLTEGRIKTQYLSNETGSCKKNGQEITWNCSPGTRKFCTYRSNESDMYWVIDEITPKSFTLSNGKNDKFIYTYSESI